jgi:hypothetical protein
MKKLPEVVILAALVLAACGSTGPAEKSAADRGGLTVTGIPAEYINGVILVGGSGENGGGFTYSPKVPQKISGTQAQIKLYAEAGMVQKPFAGSGNYLVSVELFRAGDPKQSELRYFTRRFLDGSAEIVWAEGSAKPSPPQ